MNKSELIDYISDKADLSKASATRALEAFFSGIISAISKGDTVSLTGFITVSVREREARTGRNPKTGEAIQIKATKVPVLKAGTGLKKAVQSTI